MKFKFNVIQEVEVDLDETKVTKEFMKHFSTYMWYVEDIEEIASHIARNEAIFSGYSVEGVPQDFYKAKVVDDYTEIV